MPSTPDRESPRRGVPPEVRRTMIRKMMHSQLDAGIEAVVRNPQNMSAERLMLNALAAGFDALRKSDTNAPGVYRSRSTRGAARTSPTVSIAAGTASPAPALPLAPKVDGQVVEGWHDICATIQLRFSQALRKRLYRLAKRKELPIRVHGRLQHPTAHKDELIHAWNRYWRDKHGR